MATTLARIEFRRKTAAQWTSSNEVLLASEPGVETDTGKFKLGDGTTGWSSLPYQAPTAASISATYVKGLHPSTATADGTTDDTAAISSTFTAAGNDPVQLGRKLNYYCASGLTISTDTDLNGSTLLVSGSVTIGAGVTVTNGTISLMGSGSVGGTSKAGAALRGVTVNNLATSGNGISFTTSDHVTVERCKVNGGFRGIALIRSSYFTVAHNSVTAMPTSGSYGILINGATDTYTGYGTIHDNQVIDCYYGIAFVGGEANSGNAGYADQFNLIRIVVHSNVVEVSTANLGTLVGSIWGTRATGVIVAHNTVRGGKDVGIDFEHCYDCRAIGNEVTDIKNGGLAALFGSTDIVFSENTVTYAATLTGTASTSGRRWKNTGPLMVLLRDSSQRITLQDNKFRVTNGTLGQVDLSDGATTGMKVVGNEFWNTYVGGANSASATITDIKILRNVFDFDININNPVIYHERVQRTRIVGNEIRLAAGEVLESDNRKYIAIYDAAGGSVSSDYLWFVRNFVDDGGTGKGIGYSGSNSAIHWWARGNEVDRITGWLSASPFTNAVVDANSGVTGVSRTALTAHDNAAVQLVTSSFATIGASFTVSATNASWPIPAGAQKLRITAVGGGGGGGGGGSAAAAQLEAGGGGGAAGCASSQVVTVAANTTLSVTIGAGGTSGTSGTAGGNAGGTGGTGGDTIVTGTGISVRGSGGVGGFGTTANNTTGASGGVYGSASVRSATAGGGSGGAGGAFGGYPIAESPGGGAGGGAATATLGGGGGGAGIATTAATPGASGASGTSAGVAGSNASVPGAGGGGGGGGAAGTGAGGAGGTGAAGFVIITIVG